MLIAYLLIAKFNRQSFNVSFFKVFCFSKIHLFSNNFIILPLKLSLL